MASMLIVPISWIKSDTQFKSLHGALHNLHVKGVGREVKHAKALTKEEEQRVEQ